MPDKTPRDPSRGFFRPAAGLLIVLLLGAVGTGGGVYGQESAGERPVRVRWNAVAVRDEIAFFARSTGVVLLDLSDPLRPDQLGSLLLKPEIHDLALMGEHALLAAGAHGLLLVDITDPEDLELLHRYNPPEAVFGVTVREELAFLVQRKGGLRVVDVSRPLRPLEVATVNTRGELRSIAFDGGWMATAEGTAGVRLFDMTRPRTPRDRYFVRPVDDADALDVALQGERLLVACGKGGLQVFEWTGSSRPNYIGRFEADRPVDHVTTFGDLVLVSHGSTGMSIVDPRPSDGPQWVGTTDLPRGFPVGRVTAQESWAYLTSGPAGFGLIDLTDPRAPDVVQPRERVLRVTFPD